MHRFISSSVVIAASLAASAGAEAPPGPADMSQPVQVFILMGQSNMVGLGRITGGDGSLENAVKNAGKYGYLVDGAGAWAGRADVRFTQVMQGKGLLANDWMSVAGSRSIGPEFGIAKYVGDAIDAPVLLLKSCIGNRSLGWDLLPPGSGRTVADGKVVAGYGDRPDFWVADPAQGVATEPPPWLDKQGKPIAWYAGKQYDDDVGLAKAVLADLGTHYPGATKYEVAGFFFWQGEKDAGNAIHAARYEENLVNFIRSLRKDFDAPKAKFVLATLGEAVKGGDGPGGMVLAGQLAVDGAEGRHPDFKGNVATVYTHPMAQGGSGNGHYGKNAEVSMDVGEAMGRAMVDLLRN